MIEGQLSFLPDVTMYAGVDDPLTGGFIATGVFQAAVLQPLSVRGNATADFIQYSWAHSGWFQIPKF